MGLTDAPEPDQIEINLFGPGFGECCLVHVGANEWVIVDSCVEPSTRRIPALQYLSSLGVDPARQVKLIVATHWHDDHIRGLADIVEACPGAVFCASGALRRSEFLATITAFNNGPEITAGSGVAELNTIVNLLERRKTPRRVAAPQRVLATLPMDWPDDKRCTIVSLSPSDAQFDKALVSIGELLPASPETIRRAPDLEHNDLSVVIWLRFGSQAVLLGGDLEEDGDPNLGWSAAVQSFEAAGLATERIASIFKQPHHGSANGHCDEVWDRLITPEPITILTPWNRGAGLPRPADIERILSKSERSYSSSNYVAARALRALIKRDPAVERTLREDGRRIRPALSKMGHVRLRNGG